MAFSEQAVIRILAYQRAKKAWMEHKARLSIDEDERLHALFEEAKSALASWIAVEFEFPEENGA